MLQALPTIDQDKDDFKFTEQYIQATDLFAQSIQQSQLGRWKKFSLIRKSVKHQNDITKKLVKAEKGQTQELEGVMEELRNNFQNIWEDIMKLNPDLIAPINKAIQEKNSFMPAHNMDKPMYAEHYFRMLKEGKIEDPEKEGKDKVSLVRVVNKTSIPVRVVGSTGNPDRDVKDERTFRQKMLGFFSIRDRGRTSRSIFSGRSAQSGRAVAGLLSGQGLVNLPQILSGLLASAFGSIISKTVGIALGAIGLLAKTFVGRMITLGVGLLTGVVEKGITKLVEWIFGEDSGISKLVKGVFESDLWKSAMGGGATGAGLGSLFGPAGMLWGFIIGSVAGLLKAWIDDDGPKKLKESAEKLWGTITKGIDDLYNMISNSLTGFFGGISEYFRKIFKPNQSEQTDAINKKIEDTKKEIELNQKRLENPNAEQWRKNIAQSEIDYNTQKLEKLEKQKSEIKSDSTVAKEEDIENLRVMDERLKRPFKNKLAEENYRKLRDELANKINSSNITSGMIKPPESPVTTQLYSGMIGMQRLGYMNSMTPTVMTNPTTIASSTNVVNRTNNSMVMQLSPLSNDRIK